MLRCASTSWLCYLPLFGNIHGQGFLHSHDKVKEKSDIGKKNYQKQDGECDTYTITTNQLCRHPTFCSSQIHDNAKSPPVSEK